MRNTATYDVMISQGASARDCTIQTDGCVTPVMGASAIANGTRVVIRSTGTMPTGLSEFPTEYWVHGASSGGFKLSAEPVPKISGASAGASTGITYKSVDVTAAGTGTITFVESTKGKSLWVRDYRHVVFQVKSADQATLKYQFVGAVGDSCPEFGATVRSSTYDFEYIGVIDKQDGIAIDGDTGVTLSGTDDYRQFEVNTDLLDWVTIIIPRANYTKGNLTVKAVCSTN